MTRLEEVFRPVLMNNQTNARPQQDLKRDEQKSAYVIKCTVCPLPAFFHEAKPQTTFVL